MKKYQKPHLVALSLSGNDMLCLNCSPNINDDLLNDLLHEYPNAFNQGECNDPSGLGIYGLSEYCKMTVGDQKVFLS